MIPRYLQKDVLASLNQFPVVGLIGSRQSGKTTLANMISAGIQDRIEYLDLERASDLAKLQEAELYLERLENHLVILDEVQRKPDLFPLMRSLVDHGLKKTGRFLLLGSASPDLIRQASESLAGRIVYHELNPLCLRELDGRKSTIGKLWCRGGYPPSYLADSDNTSLIWREAFIRTYLERDLPQLGVRVPAAQLRRFWQMMAHNQGQLWNASKIAASMGVSAPAIRRYLDILQDTFIVRQLLPYQVNIKKRLVKSPKVYIRDTGLLHSLLNIMDEKILLGHPYAGSSFEGFIIEQISNSIPSSWQIYFYRTNAGNEMDLVVIPANRKPIGLEIKLTKSPSLSKGFKQALDDLECEKGYVICMTDKAYPLNKQVSTLPVHSLDMFSTLAENDRLY